MADQLRVFARDFRIVQTDGVVLCPAHSVDGLLQLEARALIASLNDEQRRHFRAISVDEEGNNLPAACASPKRRTDAGDAKLGSV